MKYISYTAVFVIVATINAIISGLAFSLLWEWFIVSTFNVPKLSIASAIGVSLTVDYLFPLIKDPDDDKTTFDEEMVQAFLWVALKSIFALSIGFVVVQFI